MIRVLQNEKGKSRGEKFLRSKMNEFPHMSSTYLDATIMVVMRSRWTLAALMRNPGLIWQNRSM